MALAAEEALGRDTQNAIADKGYFSGTEIVACHKADITATVPRLVTPGNESKGMFVKADFLCDTARDMYVCPAGKAGAVSSESQARPKCGASIALVAEFPHSLGRLQ